MQPDGVASEDLAGVLAFAVQLLQENTDLGDLLRRLGEAELQKGLVDVALRSITAALDAMDVADTPVPHRVEFLLAVIERLKEAGVSRDSWEPLVERGIALLDGDRSRLWARLNLLLPPAVAEVTVPAGAVHADEWIGFADGVIEAARTGGNEDDYARTLFVHPWQTPDEIETILAESRRWTEPAAVTRSLTFAAETYLYRFGRFRRAEDLLLELCANARRRESVPDEAKALVRLALAQFALGKLRDARATVELAKAAVRRLGPGRLVPEHPGDSARDIYPEPSMRANFAYFFDGDWRTIADHWTTVAALPERRGVAIVEVAMAAFAHCRAGNTADAILLLESLTPTLEILDARTWAVNGAVGRGGRAVWYLRATEYAPYFRRFALDLIAAGVGDWPTTSNEQTVACMAALVGDLDEARAYFARARANFEPESHQPQRAIVNFDEAIALLDLGGEEEHNLGLDLLAAATRQFTSLEMEGWAKRGRAQAARHSRARVSDVASSPRNRERAGA